MEATVNRFMELGDLPFPRIRASTTTTNTKRRTKETRSDWETISEFIEKYNIDAKNPKNDHNSLLHQRRQEMILGARKRLAAQLSNEL